MKIYSQIYDGYDIIMAKMFHNMVKYELEKGDADIAWD